MLSGSVNKNITDTLYGANLIALKKKDGGIRPIAIGTTFRRLVAKICCKNISSTLTQYFQPVQLGFGSKGGCEAAVHALRTFLNQQEEKILLKVDIKNAFNSVDRGSLLSQIKHKIPGTYKFLWQCYSKPSKLFFKDKLINSATGCQQGDPLGPAIFSLAIHPIIEKLNSKFNVWYLDDGTLGDNPQSVYNDFRNLTQELKSVGLDLNYSKCELYIPESFHNRDSILADFNSIAPNITIVNKSSLRLLGAPIFDESFSSFVDEKIRHFQSVSARLLQISTHMAYFILRNCSFTPKFIYLLRCSHFWKHPNLLAVLDDTLKQVLSSIINIQFDNHSWTQATLPIRFGGLGVRKISSVCLPAFLSSAHSSKSLVNQILNSSFGPLEVTGLAEGIAAWSLASKQSNFPLDPLSQRQWDEPLCRLERKELIETSPNSAECARLLAVSEWESGQWLRALPSANIGTLLDRATFRIATCLRLGAPCNAPHLCVCGSAVDQLGRHGLSCAKSAGRIPRHAALNDIIRRAFVSVSCPSILEPNGLFRSDGKRPDGMTLVPWKRGRPIVWDATCVDTLAPSHLPGTAVKVGSAATSAENAKRHKYVDLSTDYIFVPFGVETLGPWGPDALSLYRELSERLVEVSHDRNAGVYLAQRISLAIQRGNAASMLGTLPTGGDLAQIFCL